MWLYMTDSCRSVLSNQFPAITAFQHICVLHNVGMWMFFLILRPCLNYIAGVYSSIVMRFFLNLCGVSFDCFGLV